MATTKMRVIGLAPVTFVSEDGATAGQQYHVPLSALKVDAKGQIDASDWVPEKGKKLSAGDAKLLKSILADMLRRGLLTLS
jgi:hypothetical protein